MRTSVRKMVIGALMAALCFVCTSFLLIYRLPSGGYVHLGDMMVFLCGFLPGGWIGAAAAGIGSALADLYVGAPMYAPATFVIKAAMALIVWAATRKRNPLGPMTVLSTIIGAAVMIGGYFVFEWALYRVAESGILDMLLGSVPQAVFGVVASYVVLIPLAKSGLVAKYRNL